MPPRLRAFAVHLSVSALVLAVFAGIVLVWWYPGPLLTLQGGWGVLLTILVVDVILGPSLTGLVYKPGKKGLVLDLAAIIIVQVAALGYGVASIHAQRPNYLAFTLDRFFLVSHADTVGQLPSGAAFPAWRGSVLLGTAPVTARTTSASLDDLMNPSEDNLIPPLAIMATDISPYPGTANGPTPGRGISIVDIGNTRLRETALARLADLGVAPETARAYRVVGRKSDALAIVKATDSQLLDIVR